MGHKGIQEYTHPLTPGGAASSTYIDRKGVIKGTACTLKVGMMTITTASISPDSEAAFLDCRHIFLVMLHRGGQYSYKISDRCNNALKASTVACQRMKSIGIAIPWNMALKDGM